MCYSGKYFWTILILLTGLVSACAEKQTSQDSSTGDQIDQMVKAISADSIEANIRHLVNFKTRHTLSDTVSDTSGIGAARRWIYHTMQRYGRESNGRLKVSYDRYTQKPRRRVDRPVEVVNVVAELKGTQDAASDRVYIVSGHYDSRVSDIMDSTSVAPGADDDASGTAAVMEMARVMSKYKFDATLIFMTVAGEEQGLLGSGHMAQRAKEEGWNVAGMITNDIIGSSTAQDGRKARHKVRVFAAGIMPGDSLSRQDRMMMFTGGENDTPSRQLARLLKQSGERYVDGMNVEIIYRLDRYLRGGDHMPFVENGYPAVRFTEPHEDYRHQHQDVRKENGMQYGDLAQFVDFGYTADVARVNAAGLATLALAPARPDNVGMVTSKLENSTTLRWTPNSEPDLSGYRVVWRKTTAPLWQHSETIGLDTVYTVKNVSKDNYLFGVEAVDKDGYVSPAVYPQPVR